MSTTQLQIPIGAVVSMLEEIIGRRDDDADRPSVTATTPLEDLGLDSLEIVELFLGLEGLAGYELEPPAAGWNGTVADLLYLRPASDGSPV